ncbi:MAG: AmmeMemoRadiSam system protein B [Deltaproteobacteria bacterium CG_4_8_14_3_um_filter_51_11]|nr:AmmeMemoRadiSam system protein B [bacterium]OIP42372.1 MAG: AmmeMemoRadiSam system protein B [Desulfobacteraceae bacterium CG2_30_51_40]PIP47518.1 MAG: AmmeMemoRadiSam system protein B [Deltaproteobacteria bacterium CG23_combo_of_CG06-09_8_20_14_all_51_20]PIW00663.1 MAG: AmmeMemoRadiSam system protein B [Deltaproteobacteria bacterium CG17_big_fil_post_rev_8_21_14_2_50_51_6]PIX20898.1 MAG: AmmeMemoRadiSam system protein B [Deltaproteobacteria bacterium CG_4_8_14_3_um_filter_51_11]PIY23243.1 
MDIRRADFAGSWYPELRSDCLKEIEELEHSAFMCPELKGRAVGGIVPHAGWYYSGLLSLSVIRCMKMGTDADTCIIFGRHLPISGRNFMMKGGAWATPLGDLVIDSEIAEKLSNRFPFTVETASRHEPDNTIELQLPFLKYYFPQIRILPLGLPPVAASFDIAISACEISLAMGRKTIVLGSTDLTHYGPNYDFTPHGTGNKAVSWVKEVNDRRSRHLMVSMDAEALVAEALRSASACCGGAAGSAIEAARTLGASRAEEIGYYTSYDVRADSSFVGYSGIVFYAAA